MEENKIEYNTIKILKAEERDFVHAMVYDGLDKVEAFSLIKDVPVTKENRENVRARATRLFNKPHVLDYYNSLIEELNKKEMQKGQWTREVATEKLMHLISKAEEDLYGDPSKNVPGKRLTMSTLNAIVLPVKELNLMHGFNQTNMNVSGGCTVQIIGEEDIPD